MVRMLRFPALAVAFACLALLVPAPTFADPPVKTSFSIALPPGPLGFCGGTPVMVETVIYGTQTAYSDASGTRVTVHAKTEDRLYLEGSDRTLEGHANYSVFTLAPGVERWTGVFWHVTVPGFGTVLIDAGLEVIDWSAAMPVLKAVGKHQWLEGDFDALCAALQ